MFPLRPTMKTLFDAVHVPPVLRMIVPNLPTITTSVAVPHTPCRSSVMVMPVGTAAQEVPL
jgi:hypothetical protein